MFDGVDRSGADDDIRLSLQDGSRQIGDVGGVILVIGSNSKCVAEIGTAEGLGGEENGMSNRFLPARFQGHRVIADRATGVANTLPGGAAWRG